MCNYISNDIKPSVLEDSYKLAYNLDEYNIKTKSYVNGFDHDIMPIISDSVEDEFVLGKWGFVPKYKSKTTKTIIALNAKIETVKTNNYFNRCDKNRCVIPVNGFFDNKKDEKKKIIERHKLITPDNQIFGLGAIYQIDELGLPTFAIVTTEPNEYMAEIHHRMPIILPLGMEKEWLNNQIDIQNFAFPNYNPPLTSILL